MTGIRIKVNTHVSPWILGLALMLVLATRLYHLGTFPFFAESWPWLGGNSHYPGLYGDEVARIMEALAFPGTIPIHQGSWIGTVALRASMKLFGFDNLAYRLPAALASALTAGLVFLAAKELYKQWEAALVSGLYFVVMVPALIYGRMVFYENFVALFLVAAILFIAKFENSQRQRWLYLASIASVLAAVSKVDGLTVPVFFTLWAASREGRRGKTLPVLLTWVPLAVMGLVLVNLAGSWQALLNIYSYTESSYAGLGYVGRELSVQFMAIQSMPSGYVVVAGGYFKPEFWYLYGYVCLAALVALGSRSGRLLTEALLAFVVVTISDWGLGSYYVIIVLPVIALAAGGGSRFLAKLGTTGGLAFYAGFYVPLVATYIASSTLPTVAVDYSLFLLKIGLIAVPVLVWLLFAAVSQLAFGRRLPLAPVVLLCFFALLILGTPVLYSQYFLGRAP